MNSYTGRRLCRELASTISRGAVAALATVVRTEGSTYRKAGARMLVRTDAEALGLVSGGCLEDEIAATARAVIASGQPRLLHFDLTGAEEAVLGYGKGCFGQSWILVEPIGAAAVAGTAEAQRRRGARTAIHAALCAATEAVRVALVYEVDAAGRADALVLSGRAGGVANADEAPGPQAGDRVVLDGDGRWRSTWDDSDPTARALAAAAARLDPGGRSAHGEASSPAGPVRFCIYEQRAPRGLVLFGGGPDAAPVCGLAAGLGWDVQVLEHRPALLRADRFPEAAALRGYDPDAIDRVLGATALGGASACVIMTHNLMVDARALSWAACQPQLAYIGLLGPAHRRERLFALVDAEAALAGAAAAAPPLDAAGLRAALGGRLRSPIGLALGGDTEHDIALAIVAQLQLVSHAAGAGAVASALGRKSGRETTPLGGSASGRAHSAKRRARRTDGTA